MAVGEQNHERLIGLIVGGDYRLDRVIGRGGMGTVFLATRQRDRSQYAVKIISRDHGADSTVRRRFTREAANAMRIEHPNAVRTFRVGEEHEVAWMVMDYVYGRTLAEVVTEEGRCTPDASLAWLRQLADVLESVHQLGIVHRDVKPGNIMLEGRGVGARLRLLDFGLARDVFDAAHVITVQGSIAGTPGFIAPEQRAGLTPDSRADVFSMAAVAAYMLAGRMPVASWALPLTTRMFGRARRWPPAVDDVLSAALTADPERRTPTPAVFCEALEHAVHTEDWAVSRISVAWPSGRL